MAENYVQLPSDTGNTGKLVRTNTRVVGGSTVHEHFMIIQSSGSDFQAQVISGPTLSVTGLAVYAVQAGSYLIYGAGLGGSESYIKAGSIQTYNPLGSTFILGSVYSTGSINIVSPQTVGSYAGVGSIIGSVFQLTSPWITSGTSTVAGSVYTTGSINLVSQLGSTLILSSPGSIGVYAGVDTVFGISGNIAVTVGSEVYIKAGSVQTYSPVGVGSVTVVNTRYDLGSFLLIAGSISSMPTISVATGSEVYVKGGSIFLYSGATNFTNVTQTTIPWETSGITNWGIAVGSVRILSSNGSIGVYDADNGGISVEQTRGIFGWSGVSFIGSFTGSNIFTPGVGSKLFLKGFTATSDISTKFGLAFSGGTSVFIANYTLPASGTTSINYIGFEPSGATNQPIMVNLYNAGSLDISLAIKESL